MRLVLVIILAAASLANAQQPFQPTGQAGLRVDRDPVGTRYTWTDTKTGETIVLQLYKATNDFKMTVLPPPAPTFDFMKEASDQRNWTAPVIQLALPPPPPPVILPESGKVIEWEPTVKGTRPLDNWLREVSGWK